MLRNNKKNKGFTPLLSPKNDRRGLVSGLSFKNTKKGTGFTLHHFPRSKRRDLGRGLSSKKTKNGAGFTLIELMVVITVVSIGVIGVMNLLMQIFVYTRLNQSKLTASFLAQEGVEIVRNIRDTNWVEVAAGWDEDIFCCVVPPCDCEADYNDQALSLNQQRYLKINGGFYNYDSGDQSRFKREITVDQEADGSIGVQVSVTWDDYEVKVMEQIYNWYQP